MPHTHPSPFCRTTPCTTREFPSILWKVHGHRIRAFHSPQDTPVRFQRTPARRRALHPRGTTSSLASAKSASISKSSNVPVDVVQAFPTTAITCQPFVHCRLMGCYQFALNDSMCSVCRHLNDCLLAPQPITRAARSTQ